MTWMPIGAYRNVPLPIRPIPQNPKPTYTPMAERRSILTWIPVGQKQKHVTGVRWRI
jgi:hypothetical protein